MGSRKIQFDESEHSIDDSEHSIERAALDFSSTI